jgi:hypothetical protein
MKIPKSTKRVQRHTSELIKERIRKNIKLSIIVHGESSAAIKARLRELDYEWDIERAIEANAAAFSLLGLGLASTINKRWLALPIAVAAFLMQHAVQGWCPPVPVLRRLGFRTTYEIDQERYALKVLRGDFKGLTVNGKMPDPEELYKRVNY